LPSPEATTIQEHEQVRRKYTSLAWQLWQQQYEAKFFVWHPLPEEHLRIEVVMFWQGQISQVHGWTDILGQILKPIRDAVNSIFSWFWTYVIRPGVEALLYVVNLIVNGIKGVVDSIAQTLSSVWKAVSSGVSSILSGVGSVLGYIWVQLQSATRWIWQQLEGFFSALGEVLKQIGVWIINAIKTYVVDPILGFLKAAFDVLKQIIEGIWNFITGGGLHHSPQEWRGSTMRWLGIMSGVAAMTIAGVVGLTLIDAIHPFKDTKAADVLKFVIGFSGMAFLQAAFFTTYFDIACSKPVRQELNALFTPEIPGSGDLIRFVVREVLPPSEFHVAMGLQGFSRYWSDAYWEAHWLLPPTERTRTAFLRKQISVEEYRKFLIWYDFKPEPRPGIAKSDVDIMLETQYDWPGRIDARWMLEWGQITEAEAKDLFEAEGLDPDWSTRVVKAHLLNQLRDEYNRVRTSLMTRFKEGFLKTENFKTALKDLNFAEHTIEASLKWANEVAAWDDLWEQAQEWWRLAKARKITPEAYAEAVRALGMVENRITSKQDLLRKLAEIAEAEAAAKKG